MRARAAILLGAAALAGCGGMGEDVAGGPERTGTAAAGFVRAGASTAAQPVDPTRTPTAEPGRTRSARPHRARSAEPDRTGSARPHRERSAEPDRARSAQPGRTRSTGAETAAQPRDAPAATVAAPRSDGDPVVHLTRRRTPMHAAPGGRMLTRLDRRTEYGSPRYLPVVARRGAWLGVVATERPNGRVGWIRAAHTEPAVARTRLVVDLGTRRLRVLRDGRTVLRVPVAIGAPGTATPTGRFAVTDGLKPPPGSPYGCCILALSGHQPNIPQGWAGGDRLAIHGTSDPSSIGRAASHGCLRASDRDMRRLLRIVGLGSVVEIRA